MKKKDEFEYRKLDDGKFVKVQKSEGEPQEDHDLLNEFSGLMRQEKELLKQLEECRERHATLLPHVKEIQAAHHAKIEAKKAEKSANQEAEAAGLGTEAVDEMRHELQAEAASKKMADTAAAPLPGV